MFINLCLMSEGVVVSVGIEFINDVELLLLGNCVMLIGDEGVFIVIEVGINCVVRKGCLSSWVFVYCFCGLC